MLELLPLVLAVLVATPAWQYSDEERIALRTSGEAAHERLARGGRSPSSNEAPSGRRPVVDAFDGKTHPELFLPHEVFDELVNMAFNGDPHSEDIVRHGLDPAVRAHGLPVDFWSRLRAIDHDDLCRSRAAALTAARAEFGRQRFDRFLYEVIAVHMFYVADRLPDP